MKKVKVQVYDDEPELTTDLTDPERTLAWYSLAARSEGNPDQAKLCELYLQKEGIDWYFQAAAKGDNYAKYTLGKMYANGVGGVEVNEIRSATWYSKASAAGISYAHYELAKMCKDGIGIDADPEYADGLFRKACSSLQKQEKLVPDPHAQYILATVYEYGLGVEKNLNLAQYWRALADNGAEEFEGNDDAQDVPEEVEPEPLSAPVSSPMSTECEDDSIKDAPVNSLPQPEPMEEIFSGAPRYSVEPAFPQSTVLPVPSERKKAAAPKIRKSPVVKKKQTVRKVVEDSVQGLDFTDMILPSVIDFKHPDYFVCGNTFRCVWAIREYPTETEQLAILRELGEKSGVTLHVYVRPVNAAEENKIIKVSERRNRHKKNIANDLQESVSADVNMQDIRTLVTNRYRNKETLEHCAVFFEQIAHSKEALMKLQNEVTSICTRSKLVCDKLWLHQKEGFLTVMPTGSNQFGTEFERVMPSSSVGNLYPYSYSGKTDPKGMFIGEDVNGTNIIVDFDARSESKTNGHIIVLGNSGEGKTHLLHLIITNKRQQGKKLYTIDVENDYSEQTERMGGCSLDMMGGKYFINPLEPRFWTDTPITKGEEDYKDGEIPAAFKQDTRLSQHIAYLRDFFRSYKDFSTQQLDTLEILLEKLYTWHHITDNTDFSSLKPEKYPIPSDLFKLAEQEIEDYDDSGSQLYTKDILRSLTLGLRSICIGAESKFFNGFTNITNSDFINFSVKDMMNTNENLKNAMYLNIFSWMSHKFLTEGNTDLILDEFHEFVKNKIAVDYTRSFMKRGRKRNSDVVLASQNVEDLLLREVVEYTKPLFSIPTHSFLFNPGQNCDAKAFQQALNVPDSEWELIKNPRRGHCLFRSGNERYHLHVIAPDYKRELFGSVGGN